MTDVNVTMYTTPYGIPGPRGSNADPTVDFARESTVTSLFTSINTLNTTIAGLQTISNATVIGGITLNSQVRAFGSFG
jgi:hypothetical protein